MIIVGLQLWEVEQEAAHEAVVGLGTDQLTAPSLDVLAQL